MTSPLSEHPTFLEDMKLYVGFGDDSTAALRQFLPIAAPHFPRIVDDFYGAMERHPSARVALFGGGPRLDGLKRTLTRWLETLLAGPHDQTYLESRAHIGHVHVRNDLPQAYMFTAMNRIRVHLSAVLDEHGAAFPQDHQRMSVALQQILDLDLAIMAETYREDLLAKNRRSERLATVGQFAAGIAHELRNPLAVIESSVYLLRGRLETALSSSPEGTKHLDRIAKEVRRSSNTIRDLLALASSRPPRVTPTVVKDVVDEAIEAALLPAKLTIDIDVSPTLVGTFDGDQLRHVLGNLLTNASEALGGEGRVEVLARGQAGALEVRVRDEGPGIPESVRGQIFEPLFTTKAHGSGIGLALCRSIIEAHGGTIELAPEKAGTTFVLRLPVVGTGAA